MKLCHRHGASGRTGVPAGPAASGERRRLPPVSERPLPYRLLFTSNHVVDETLTRLLYEAGHPAAVQGLRLLRGSTVLRIVHVTEDDERRADEAFLKYADHRISYTGCTSKVLVERLGIDTVFSFDRDFETMGVSRIP